MFIQNAVLKSISAEGLTFPLSEGSVVSVGGVTGIVPTTLGVRPATNRIYVAVAGTIDMTSDANKGVTFTDEQIKALGGDFNFVPAVESGGDLPSTSGKSGKVLSVNSSGELEWAGAVLPEASGGDMGKVATINSNGKWYKGDIPVMTTFVHFAYEDGSWTVDNSSQYVGGYGYPIVFVEYDTNGDEKYSYDYMRTYDELTSKWTWKVMFKKIVGGANAGIFYDLFTWTVDGNGDETVTVTKYDCQIGEE